jgi:hypothetical protein
MITGERDLGCDRGGLMVCRLSRERELNRYSSCMIIGAGDLDRERLRLPGSITSRVVDRDRDLLRVVGPETRIVRELLLRECLDSPPSPIITIL